MTQPVSKIVLCAVNVRYHETSLGLRYLLANMGDLEAVTILKEFRLGVREHDIVEQILECDPRIVGLSVYLWNVEVMTKVSELLRSLRPDLTLVIGGPEVSHEWEETHLFQVASYLVRGEGDVAFADLCRQILANELPPEKVVQGGRPALNTLKSPYPQYTTLDLWHCRNTYMEATRGDPLPLSPFDQSARSCELDTFLEEMRLFLVRGVRHFRFVDYTFSLESTNPARILRFFLERYSGGLELHFSMIPDRLPDNLKPLISAFAPGALQIEVGIWSFNEEVCVRIGRPQNARLAEKNLRYLKEKSGAHIHAELLAGLPGEDLQSFARGFDTLAALAPAKIHVRILKRLKGTPIALGDPEWGMVYARSAPYEVFQTSHLSFSELQRLRRFSRYWDLVGNSGRFPEELPRLLAEQPFERFMAFSDWLYARMGVTTGISLGALQASVAGFLALPSESSSIHLAKS